MHCLLLEQQANQVSLARGSLALATHWILPLTTQQPFPFVQCLSDHLETMVSTPVCLYSYAEGIIAPQNSKDLPQKEL